MTNYTAKRGMSASRKIGGKVNNGAINSYPVKNGYATALFADDPVKVSAGFIQQLDTVSAKPVGVVTGFAYVDSDGTPKFTKYLPASTSSKGVIDGYDSPVAYVVDDPDTTFVMIADATLSAGDVGLYFDVTIGSGDTYAKQSTARLKASTRAAVSANDHHVQVIGLTKLPGNDYTTSVPVVEVRFLNHLYG